MWPKYRPSFAVRLVLFFPFAAVISFFANQHRFCLNVDCLFQICPMNRYLAQTQYLKAQEKDSWDSLERRISDVVVQKQLQVQQHLYAVPEHWSAATLRAQHANKRN